MPRGRQGAAVENLKTGKKAARSTTLFEAEASAFQRYPIGFFHMDIVEVQTAEKKP